MGANTESAGAKRAGRAPERASKEVCEVFKLLLFGLAVIMALEDGRDIGLEGTGLREFSMQMGPQFSIAVQMEEGFQRLRIAHDFGGKQVCRLGVKSEKEGLQAVPNAV
jgi:hypothetical protein